MRRVGFPRISLQVKARNVTLFYGSARHGQFTNRVSISLISSLFSPPRSSKSIDTEKFLEYDLFKMIRFYYSVKDAKRAFRRNFFTLCCSSLGFIFLWSYVKHVRHEDEVESRYRHTIRHTDPYYEVFFVFVACNMTFICSYGLLVTSVPPMDRMVSKIKRAFGGKRTLAVKNDATQKVRMTRSNEGPGGSNIS